MNQLHKICLTCGRQITWRKKWEKNWSTITYCSNTCRSHKPRPNSLDTKFESKIISLLRERQGVYGIGKGIVTCEEVEVAVLDEWDRERAVRPSVMIDKAGAHSRSKDRVEKIDTEMIEVAEKGDGAEIKRPRERCRQAARRLAARGEVVITQKGKVVDPSFAKGVLELRLPAE